MKQSIFCLCVGSALLLAVSAAAQGRPDNPQGINVNQRPTDTDEGNGTQVAPPSGGGGQGTGQPGVSGQGTGGGGVQNQQSQAFIRTALRLNQAEIQLSRAAAEKAVTPEVRAYAQDMVQEHTALASQLRRAARASGVSATATALPRDRITAQVLRGLTGIAFDEAYMDEMVSSHQKAVTLYQQASSSGSAATQRLASAALPTLQDHLSRAQSLSGAISSSLAANSQCGSGLLANQAGTGGTTGTAPVS